MNLESSIMDCAMSKLLFEAALYQVSLDICSWWKLHTENYKSHTKPFSIPPSDKLALNSKTTTKNPAVSQVAALWSSVSCSSQEQSVKVVTMLPLRWVTVLQCCFPEPWNLLSVLELCVLKENIFSKSSNMSSKSPPPKPPC